MSKCRGKGRTRGNCVCENLDDWEVVPPLTTREHRKGCTVGRSNVEFDLGYIEFEILAECLCEQPGTYGNVGMELGKELRPRDFMQIWKSSPQVKATRRDKLFRRKFRCAKRRGQRAYTFGYTFI